MPGPTDAGGAPSAARAAGVVVVLGVNERDHGTPLQHAAGLRRRRHAWSCTAARSRRPTTSAWSGARATAPGCKVVDTRVGRVGALACWEHYNPLARYALMAQHEEIHCAQFPGSLVGPIFAEQIEVTIRHHALESGCFVVNATGWLTAAQQRRGGAATPGSEGAVSGGCFTAIVSPEGMLLGDAAHRRRGHGVSPTSTWRSSRSANA